MTLLTSCIPIFCHLLRMALSSENDERHFLFVTFRQGRGVSFSLYWKFHSSIMRSSQVSEDRGPQRSPLLFVEGSHKRQEFLGVPSFACLNIFDASLLLQVFRNDFFLFSELCSHVPELCSSQGCFFISFSDFGVKFMLLFLLGFFEVNRVCRRFSSCGHSLQHLKRVKFFSAPLSRWLPLASCCSLWNWQRIF